MGLVLQLVLSPAAIASWGFRVPFVIGAVLAVVVFALRRGLVETRAVETVAKARDAPRSSVLHLVREHPMEALAVIGLTAGGTLAFYAYTTYMQKFLVVTSGFTKETATRITAAALAIFMVLQPAFGALSDRVGRRPLMIAFGIAGAVLTVPIFEGVARARDPLVAFLLVLGALVIVSGYTSINAVVKAELFPAEIRTLGVALPYAIANTMFGGTAEYVALWFKKEGVERAFYVYVAGGIAVSLLVYVFMRETKTKSRIVED
ncbi:MAG: MFS transporter [Polyangiaceae bacterium]